MKKIHYLFSLMFIALNAFAQPTNNLRPGSSALMLDTNGVIIVPTNFFHANTVRLNAEVIGGGGGGGSPVGSAGGDLGGSYPNPTVAAVGSVTAANVANGANLANASTSANTASVIVRRDSNGDFVTHAIVATNLTTTGTISNNSLTARTLMAASANKTETSLPAGADGQILVQDSAQTLGVKWTNLPSLSNTLAYSNNAYFGDNNNHVIATGMPAAQFPGQLLMTYSAGIGGNFAGQLFAAGNDLSWRRALQVGRVVAFENSSGATDAILAKTTNGIDNCITLQNLDLAHYSAMRWVDAAGNEKGAVGYGNTNASVYSDIDYLEGFGSAGFYFVGSGKVYGGLEKNTGGFVWFDGTHNTDTSSVPVFHVDKSGNVSAAGTGYIAGATTISNSLSVTGPITDNGLTASTIVVADSSKRLASGTIGTGLALSSGALSATFTPSTTNTLQNKTISTVSTGGNNTIKMKGYIVLTTPMLCDGAGAVIQTNDYTKAYWGQAQFSASAATNANYIEYRVTVPEDFDSSVELKVERWKFRLAAADTAAHKYNIGMASVADSAGYDSPTIAQWTALPFAGDASGASGDVETVSGVTLTGWKGNLTAGQLLVIRVNRDGANDASTQASFSGPLVISYGVSQ